MGTDGPKKSWLQKRKMRAIRDGVPETHGFFQNGPLASLRNVECDVVDEHQTGDHPAEELRELRVRVEELTKTDGRTPRGIAAAPGDRCVPPSPPR